MKDIFSFNDYEWKVKQPTGKNRRELKNMASRIKVEGGDNTVIELKQGDIEVYNFCNRLEYLKKSGVNIELSQLTFDNMTDIKMLDEVINSITKFDIELEKEIKK